MSSPQPDEEHLVRQLKNNLNCYFEYMKENILEANNDITRGQMALIYVYLRYMPILEKKIEQQTITEVELKDVRTAQNSITEMRNSLARQYDSKTGMFERLSDMGGRVNRYVKSLPTMKSLKEETVKELEVASSKYTW